MGAKPKAHSFEDLADFDIDGAAFAVGVEHFPLGPPGPFIRINTGAIEVLIRGHHTDVEEMIDALILVRKELTADKKAKARKSK